MNTLFITLIVLLSIFIVMLSGGIYLYFNIFRKLTKEFKEFVLVTFNALKDKKITDEEREQILKELSDLSPYAKELKTKFVDDAVKLEKEVKEIYEKLKDLLKTKTK